MPVFQLTDEPLFPPPELADPSGVLCVGGDLEPDRLLLGYRMGIFPWPHEGLPLLWFSPDPRFVLFPGELHVGKSLRKSLRRRPFELRFDTAFDETMAHCSKVPRPGQDGTWITDELLEAYTRLYRLGYAHSVEAWNGDRLVGGLYGVSLGRCFFGESMFALEPEASKVAFVTLVAQLSRWNFSVVDCQVETRHLSRFGARDIKRREFLRELNEALQHPDRVGKWTFDPEVVDDPMAFLKP